MNPSQDNRPPSFSFYVKDWLTSKKRAVMPLACQAGYINLLAHCWDTDDCSLPEDSQTLAALSELRGDWETYEAQLRSCFVPHKNSGYITNERLFKEFRERMQYKKDRSVSGAKGGKASGVTRRKKREIYSEANVKQARSSASVLLEANTKQNEALQSSVFSLQSSINKEKSKTPRVLVSDEDWIAGLKTDPIYTGIDIDLERRKAMAWYQQHGRKFTRAAFTNWLIKAMGDKPLTQPKKRILLT